MGTLEFEELSSRKVKSPWFVLILSTPPGRSQKNRVLTRSLYRSDMGVRRLIREA
jgi:hypothetical protein